MMRQDNLLQERMYHIVIKEQRSFSCSVFAIRVLTLPNQTKVNSAEPKLQVLNSSYIQICTYVAFSLLRILENSLQLDCNVFIMFVELADQLAKTERCRATITERFLAVSCHTYCSDQIVRYKEQYRQCRHVGKTDRTEVATISDIRGRCFSPSQSLLNQ